MKKRCILLVVLLFIGFASAYSQGLRSTLSVNVVESEPADSLGVVFYPYKLKITQDFDVSSLKKDTLHLKLENTSFFQSLRAEGDPNFALIPNMNVCAKMEEEVYRKVDYSFNGVDILIPDNNYSQIRVEYGYYSDLCFRTEIDVEACGVLFHPVDIFVDVSGIDDEEEVVFAHFVDEEVVDCAAVWVEHHAVVDLSDGCSGDVVSEDVLNVSFGVGSGDAHFAHVAYVEYTAIVAYGVVFVCDVGVLNWHDEAAKG